MSHSKVVLFVAHVLLPVEVINNLLVDYTFETFAHGTEVADGYIT